MAKYWVLINLDDNGMLSVDEFTLAFYLVIRRYAGNSFPTKIPVATVMKAIQSNSTIA